MSRKHSFFDLNSISDDKLDFIIKYLFTLIFTILILFCSINFYVYVIHYAEISNSAACKPLEFKEVYSKDYVIAGTFSASFNGTSEVSNITYYYTPDKSTIAHEECHARQYKQHRLYGCSNRILKNLNEIECYSIQRVVELLGWGLYITSPWAPHFGQKNLTLFSIFL